MSENNSSATKYTSSTRHIPLRHVCIIGFSRNQFNYGEGQENIGNNVTLVSDTRSYLCDIHKDGTHERQITCYTR